MMKRLSSEFGNARENHFVCRFAITLFLLMDATSLNRRFAALPCRGSLSEMLSVVRSAGVPQKGR
jgi:hypothetical protein